MFDPNTLYNKLKSTDPGLYTLEKCQDIAIKLDRIVELKKHRNAVILAHNYQRPEIFEIADFLGDSLGLSMQAADVEQADVIVFCGVHFMAETAKIVSPSKTVLLPNLQAGCFLADTADADDLADRKEMLREQYPDLAVVSYVNTTAAVKALSEATCTSSNAVDVVRNIPSENILFVPDQNLARYVAKMVPEKNIIAWEGYCDVHQDLQPEEIRKVQDQYPNLKVLVHPECRDDVVKMADAVMSTSGMITYAQNDPGDQFLAVTECGLSDLLTINVPHKQFFRACKICRFMKMITLENVIESLEKMRPEITLDEGLRVRAEEAINRMFELTKPEEVPQAVE